MIRTSPLIEDALFLADHGVDIDTAARRLGTTRAALERALNRAGVPTTVFTPLAHIRSQKEF